MVYLSKLCYFAGNHYQAVTVSEQTKIAFYHYNADECIYTENYSLEQCAAGDKSTHVNWLSITGLNPDILKQLGNTFKIHPLVMEDIANTRQRAKVEEYGDYLFVVLRMFAVIDGEIKDQQVAFVLRDNFVITIREADFFIFKKVVGDKLINGNGNIRKKGEDYLFYMLLDVIIDNYYLVLHFLDDKIEALEKSMFRQTTGSHLAEMQHLKGQVLYIRKHLIPARDLVNQLLHNEVEYFDKANKYYLRDLQDHMIRNVEEVEFHRDQLSDLMELFYSLQNQKMNNVMKTLTVISTIFMPLTFIVGVYGMNFEYLPELQWHYGYHFVWGVMLVMIVAMLLYFKHLGWFTVNELRSRKQSELND